MKFRFESEDIDGSRCIKEFEESTWPEVLIKVREFLEGSGFVLGPGEIVFEPEEEEAGEC